MTSHDLQGEITKDEMGWFSGSSRDGVGTPSRVSLNEYSYETQTQTLEQICEGSKK